MGISGLSSLFLPISIGKFGTFASKDSDGRIPYIYIGNRAIAIISEWSQIEEFQKDLKLRKHFTMFPCKIPVDAGAVLSSTSKQLLS